MQLARINRSRNQYNFLVTNRGNERSKLLFQLRNANGAFDLADDIAVLVSYGRDIREYAALFQQHNSTRISVRFTSAAAPVCAVIGRRLVGGLNGAGIDITGVIEAVGIVEAIAAIGTAFPD